jgi:hypothetical protein
MPSWSDQLGGSGQASQAVLVAQASSLPLVASNGRRLAVSMYAGGGPVFVGYGATAVPSVSMPLASGALIEESNYKGPISVVTGASGR